MLIYISNLADKLINVPANLLWPFLVEKVSNSFHHNYFLQKGYISLEPTPVYVLPNTWCIVGHVQVTYNKLDWNFNLQSCEWCSQLPVSATPIKDKTNFRNFQVTNVSWYMCYSEKKLNKERKREKSLHTYM